MNDYTLPSLYTIALDFIPLLQLIDSNPIAGGDTPEGLPFLHLMGDLIVSLRLSG